MKASNNETVVLNPTNLLYLDDLLNNIQISKQHRRTTPNYLFIRTDKKLQQKKIAAVPILETP